MESLMCFFELLKACLWLFLGLFLSRVVGVDGVKGFVIQEVCVLGLVYVQSGNGSLTGICVAVCLSLFLCKYMVRCVCLSFSKCVHQMNTTTRVASSPNAVSVIQHPPCMSVHVNNRRVYRQQSHTQATCQVCPLVLQQRMAQDSVCCCCCCFSCAADSPGLLCTHYKCRRCGLPSARLC